MSDPINRLNATLEGRYRIERELGEGGMATVYLAKDVKHNRNVALKVLKPELAAVVGAERFLAEIETTANLQHPHILPLFDSGEADSFLFYVMPFVEGETLRDKLDREHQLPVDDAVQIAKNVAEALDYAHSQGVIHRDIKPANILLQAGKPVISDFGIALAVGAAGGGRLTETGLSLGTPHYMSPEQATGDAQVGPATDTYALGCVLYEMLVGEPPFTGSTPQAVLGKILTGEVPSARFERSSVPPNVDAVIAKALEKVPADRFRAASAFATAMGDRNFRHGESLAAPTGSVGVLRRASGVAFAATGLIGLAVAVVVLLREPPAAAVQRFAAPFGVGDGPSSSGTQSFTLSPDGSFLVYRQDRGDGVILSVREWGALNSRPLQGTNNGSQPSVSPSGQEVAFTYSGGIRVASLNGGPARTLLPNGTWAHWGHDDFIYATVLEGTVRVRPEGGAPEEVTRLEAEDDMQRISAILPGERFALLTADLPTGAEVRVVELATGEMKTLASGLFPRYVDPGYLVYVATDGTLMAAPFDVTKAEPEGQPVSLLEGVRAYSISPNGTLFYSLSDVAQATELVWVDREGVATPVEPGWSFDAGGGNIAWSLSPDGNRVAVRAVVDGNFDIWIKDLVGGQYSRLTFDASADWSPHWTPDGEHITFVSIRGGDRDVWTRRADGTGDAELLYDHPTRIVEGFWSPDMEWLVLRGGAAGAALNTRDIMALRPGADSIATPLLAEEYDERYPVLSPDGQFMAYVSNETGTSEVFVRPFPDVDSGRWQVSSDEGFMPVWANNGRELFFVDGSPNLVAARIETEPVFRVLSTEPLFELSPEYQTSLNNRVLAVSPNDQRFLMGRLLSSEVDPGAATVLVQNFDQELKRLVPN